MARACRGDRRVLVRGVVSTLMLLSGEVLMHDNMSMGWGGVLVKTGASANPTSQDVLLMSVSGHVPMPAVGMVSVEYGGASARWSNQVTNLK